MAYFLSAVAALDLIITCYFSWQILMGCRRLQKLHEVTPLTRSSLPKLSVIVAARNEERDIEPALQSLLKLDYEPLEIIVANDRSVDRTGEILEKLAAGNSRLKIIHIQSLPSGWLGKNHALECGSLEATGDFLLFTDADIVMDPSVARRAMAYMLEQKLDHLAAFFRVMMPNWFLESFVVLFSMYFFAYFKPWKVRDPKSSAHVGIGGFNLIKKEVYRKIGTHRAIAVRPDDDVKLGKLIKKHGFSQDVVVAFDLIRVPWYSSVSELIHGLEKNAFAGVDYRVGLLIGSSLFALAMHFGPFVAVFFTSGLTRWLFAAVDIVLLGLCMGTARQGKLRMSTAFAFPIVVLLFVFIQWRTMLLNLWHGGIRWRDTFYPLAELKANKV
jgi:glycosyltransferase involved in cell wall biosynthesis